jgi:predicted PilT family ATPase
MTRSRRFTGVLLGAFLALAVVPTVFAAGNRQVVLRASNAYRAATGAVQYQSQPGQRELQIEVDHIRSLAGKDVNVYVGGSKIGSARVSSRGVAELVRNSELAQHVPQVRAGTNVTVQTSAAATIVSGAF